MRFSRRDLLHAASRIGAGAAAASVIPFANCQPPASRPSASVLAPPAAASLGARAAQHGLLYGCAVDVHALATDPGYAALIREQCRILVAENAMKWRALRPTPDTYRFDEADALVAFAEANQMKIRGHNLLWHLDNPNWIDTAVTPANARHIIASHIETVVSRYAGRMHSWDVVNEAIEINDGRADGMRNSPWLHLAGEDYIELAFQTARKADPQTLLTYNEYGIEDETPEAEHKRQAVMGMLRRMVARRVPVDAVGVQSHIAAAVSSAGNSVAVPAPYGAGLTRFLAEARELGLQVFLTEMDVNDRKLPADIPSRDAAVAAAYKQYLDLVLADPAVRAVLTWGITDRYTWLNHEGSRSDGQSERALPFDSGCHPKPAALAITAAFDNRGSDARQPATAPTPHTQR